MALKEVREIQTLLVQERWREAAEAASAALERHPTNPRLNAQLGYCYWHQGQFERAREFFERATLCDIRFFEAGLMLVRSLDRLHRFQEALAVARHWTKFDPNDAALQGLLRGLERQVPDELGQWTRSVNTPEHYDVEIHGPEK